MEDQKDGFPFYGAVQISKDGFLLMVLLGGSVYLKGGAWLDHWEQVLEGDLGTLALLCFPATWLPCGEWSSAMNSCDPALLALTQTPEQCDPLAINGNVWNWEPKINLKLFQGFVPGPESRHHTGCAPQRGENYKVVQVADYQQMLWSSWGCSCTENGLSKPGSRIIPSLIGFLCRKNQRLWLVSFCLSFCWHGCSALVIGLLAVRMFDTRIRKYPFLPLPVSSSGLFSLGWGVSWAPFCLIICCD